MKLTKKIIAVLILAAPEVTLSTLHEQTPIGYAREIPSKQERVINLWNVDKTIRHRAGYKTSRS
jgi:hypothetical protein